MAAVQDRPRILAEAPAVTKWTVMVRHSPFLLKQANVDADGPETAKAKFLELCRQKHEARASRIDDQRALDENTRHQTKRAIKQAFDRGIEAMNRDELVFVIRPTAEVEKERKALEERRKRAWGDPDNV